MTFKPFFCLRELCIIIFCNQSAVTMYCLMLSVQYVFSANVMVRVATRPAENPMGIISKKLSLGKTLQSPQVSCYVSLQVV